MGASSPGVVSGPWFVERPCPILSPEAGLHDSGACMLMRSFWHHAVASWRASIWARFRKTLVGASARFWSLGTYQHESIT